MIFYFSGCGNSRHIAQEIANATQNSLQFIPDLQREGYKECTFSEGDTLGFVFPVYSWGCPMLVEDFIRSVKWNGKPAYTWMACTCGDEMGMTSQMFAKVLQEVGLELNASFGFQMPNTYVAMKGFGIDKPELAQRKIDVANAKLPSVIEQIRQHLAVRDDIIGSLPRLKSYWIRPGFVKYAGDKKYFSTEDCNGCGLCTRVCPLKNITLEDKRPAWHGNCTQCMACFHHCPKHAVQYGSATKGMGQYIYKG